MNAKERLSGWWLLLKDPAAWSARWYRRKNTYDHAFAQPQIWRDPREEEGPVDSNAGVDKEGRIPDTLV
jgi:hypothetical protein